VLPFTLFSLHGPSPPPSIGFLFSFIVDSRLSSLVHPLTPHFLCALLTFSTVGILFPSFTIGAELSKPFCEVPFSLGYVVLSGNTSVSNFKASSSSCIRQSFGRAHSSCSSQVFGLVLPTSTSLVPSRSSVTATLPPPAGTLLPLSLASTLLPHPIQAGTLLLPPPSRQPSIAIRKHALVTPVPLAVANPVCLFHQGPLFDVLTTLVLNLPLGTTSFPGTAPSRKLILSFPKLWLICVIYQMYISFVRGPYFSFILILPVADVAKGSPLLPACFFLF